MLLITLSPYSQAAELKAFVSHNIVQVGQFIEFSLQLSGKSSSGDPDFSALEQDFDIVSGISRSSQTQIINGSMSSSTTWSITITPKKEGAVVIAPIKLAGLESNVITIVVGAAPEKKAADAWFETGISSREVYVQAQARLDLQLYIRMANISNSQLDELKLDNAKIIPLSETKQSEVLHNGIRYYLLERSYFIYPEKSGKLEIPSLNFSAIVNEGSRFSSYGTRRRITAQSDAISLNVLGIPDSYPKNAVWLPAESIKLHDRLSSLQIKAGEPVTRTITTTARGLPASALPPIQFEQSDKLRIYPDQGTTQENHDGKSLIATRQDALALIANEVGEIELPAFKLPWWNTKTNTLEYARLNHSKLNVTEAISDSNSIQIEEDLQAVHATTVQQSKQLIWWLLVGFLFIWLVTVFAFMYHIKKLKNTKELDRVDKQFTNPLAHTAYTNVLDAIKQRDLNLLRSNLIQWGKSKFPDQAPHGLVQLSQLITNEHFRDLLSTLDRHLYKQDTEQEFDFKQFEHQFIQLNKEDNTENKKKYNKGIKLQELYKI